VRIHFQLIDKLIIWNHINYSNIIHI